MDKYILITGGTKGIGKSIAVELAKAGYNLILTYASDEQTAIKLQQELQSNYSVEVSILLSDITQKESVDFIHSFLLQNAQIIYTSTFGRITAFGFNSHTGFTTTI